MIVAVAAAVAAAVRSDRVVACLRTRKSSLDDPLHSLDDDAHYASYGERTSRPYANASAAEREELLLSPASAQHSGFAQIVLLRAENGG